MNKKILIPAILFIAIALIVLQGLFRNRENMSTEINNTLGYEWLNSKNDLGKIKSAVLYESITEGQPVGKGRSAEDISKLLKETNADLIFRGFWRWYPSPNSPEDISPEISGFYSKQTGVKPSELSFLVEKSGHNYAELEKRISAIKKEKPGIIFVGAIPAQRINRVDKNDITGKIYATEETWAMALDPGKWDIQKDGKLFAKEEFQALFAGWHGWAESGNYDYNNVEAYFPDITNQDFQDLLLSWAYRQIDAGADAVWIDGLPQTSLLYPFVKDANHPFIKDFYKANQKIVDEIHKYGQTKGKYIYVGSWGVPLQFVEGLPYAPLNIDFVTITPTDQEILDKKISDSYIKITHIRNLYGNTPIFSFIDWGVDQSPIVNFSQRLSKNEQKELLGILDESFVKVGVNFIYPLHGGYMGKGKATTRLSFGKYRNYDSLAPEFDTYGTIKELANKKSGK